MSFSIIAAIAKNNVISKDNKLPWHIPEDLEYFYKTIQGKPVVMGRKTHESIGASIKNSENIVLSHDLSLRLPGCLVMHSVTEVVYKYKNSSEEVMIIGGAPTYEQFLPFVDKMYLTIIYADIDGDLYFPEWQQDEWEVMSQRDSRSSSYPYSFVVLQRKTAVNFESCV